MTLKSSVVIFQALESLQPQWPLQPQQPQQPQWPQQPHFIKYFTHFDGWIIPSTEKANISPFFGMDHQKSNFSLIYDTLSVGGCWGLPMLLFWKLINETQIFKLPEPTRHHNQKILILLPLRVVFCMDRTTNIFIYTKLTNVNASISTFKRFYSEANCIYVNWLFPIFL